MTDLIAHNRPFGRITDYPNTQDLYELLALDEVRGQTIMWLEVCCWEDDHQRLNCLKKESFQPEPIESVYFNQSLNDLPERITLLPGFLLRSLTGEQEMKAYVDLHQKAFGTSQMTIAFRRAIMTSPEYDAQLDLVIQDFDGWLAAFRVCQINESENKLTGERSGLTDQIGVHPDFRNIGLAKALINEGLVRLRSRGMCFARLGTSSDNFAMIHLAKTTGFIETSRKLWFSRKVSS